MPACSPAFVASARAGSTSTYKVTLRVPYTKIGLHTATLTQYPGAAMTGTAGATALVQPTGNAYYVQTYVSTTC